MSPWFVICCGAFSYFMSHTAPRYNGAFAIMAGFFVMLGLLMLGLGRA